MYQRCESTIRVGVGGHRHDRAQCAEVGEFCAQHIDLWPSVAGDDGGGSCDGFRSWGLVWVGEQREDSREEKGGAGGEGEGIGGRCEGVVRQAEMVSLVEESKICGQGRSRLCRGITVL